MIAREQGLEPLAMYLWEQQRGELGVDQLAATFVNAEKGVASVNDALTGARYIIAEMISENADFRKAIRQMMMDGGFVIAKAIEGVEDPEGKFKMYADYREAASKIPSHRMLAIRRGAKEGFLNFEIDLDREKPVLSLKNKTI